MIEGQWLPWSPPFINDSDHTVYFAMSRDGRVLAHLLQLAPGQGLSHDSPRAYGFDKLLMLPQVQQ